MVGKNVGKYRVLDKIGKGGMGTVYRATDEMLHRDVAIKVLNAELNDPEVAKRFRAEAITVARLSHPGIATIYELFEHEGEWLMVMEFVRGETLENMVARMGALSAQRSAELSMQALAALAHAHSMGVVHRDLKPANLMITENGSVKVMDFGIARVSGSEHLTNAGFMMGTPAYMAPEQVRGGDVDARADLYAMGVVFYRLTTAKLPFKGDTAFAMAQSQVSDPPTPVGSFRSDLPGWVEEIVTRALAKLPEQRFQSAAEFHEALARCLAGLPISSMYGSQETMLTPSRMPSGAIISRPMAMPTPSASYPMPSGPQPIPSGSNPIYSSGSAPTMVASSGATPMAPPSGATAMPPSGGHVVMSTDVTSMAPSGAMPVSAAAAPSGAQAAVAGPPAPGAAAKSAQTAQAKKSPVLLYGLIGAGVLAIVVAGIVMTSNKGEQPTPSPTATSEAVATPPADPGAVASDPAAAANQNPNATQTPLAANLAVPGAVNAAGPGARAGATPVPGRGTPTPTTTTGAPAGSTPTPAAGTDAAVSFTDVKMLEVSGKKGVDRDAVLNFGGGQIVIMPRTGTTPYATLPYRRITKATFVRAKDPKWDPSLASPPAGFDASSLIGGLLRSAKPWLVLQGADHFEIFRLDDKNFRQILEAFETRTGIKIDRP